VPSFPRPRLRSPLARAVVPVAAGILFFVVLFAVTWGVASMISGDPDRVSDDFAPDIFKVGPVEAFAESVAEEGPILFPDLKSASGVRSIVLDHVGDEPSQGWQVFYGYPADSDRSCVVEHIRGTRNFRDCNGRMVNVEDLARPPDVRPLVENRETLYIDLRGVTSPAG